MFHNHILLLSIDTAPNDDMVPSSSSGMNMASPTDAQGAKPPQQMQQQHAITYVTTIRNRFANEPETYRFVFILSTTMTQLYKYNIIYILI